MSGEARRSQTRAGELDCDLKVKIIIIRPQKDFHAGMGRGCACMSFSKCCNANAVMP